MDQTNHLVSRPALMPAEPVFPGTGEMAERMRALDWSKTPLGSPEGWSPSLRMMVRFLLANRFPLLLWWGPRYISMYNDAYRPVLGTKHPWALGQPVRDCWREIWPILQPLIDTPYNGGPATWDDDILLEIDRHGFVEETHFTIAYSPVPDDTVPSGIGGVLATVHEITEKVVGERRVAALRDLGARVGEAKATEEACAIAAQTLVSHAKDVPFVLLYLVDANGTRARLAGSAGVQLGADISPLTVDLRDAHRGGWPFAEAVRTEAAQVVPRLDQRFAAIPPGPWSDPPNTAIVLPIPSNRAHETAALLVAGVSARLTFDERYRDFLELVRTQIASSIANARAYEDERRRAEALAELDRAKTTFFSNVSHEFRTPLTLMLAPLEDLLNRGAALPPDDRAELEVAHRNALRLLKLVNRLLDFARIEAGRIQAAYEPTDLSAFTLDLASAFRSLVERAGLTLAVDCPPLDGFLAAPVYVDRDMWEKIVLNLLSNAFKFTFQGQIRVRLRAVDEGQRVQLTIQDTGTGILPEEVPRLFERFHRVQGARARSHEGSGLGLALVHDLVRLHGGTIEVESTIGDGSTFTLTIPTGAAHLPADRVLASREIRSPALSAASYVEEARRWLPEGGAERDGDGEDGIDWPREDRAGGAERGDAGASDRRRARVLVADDNADLRDYLRRLLSAHYAVEAVTNGAEAREVARRRPPDLVLADVMMPELDGFGLLRALRDDPRTRAIPVVLLSARAGEEATIEGLEAGADDYLVKPFSGREVLARVKAHLEIAWLRQEALARARELEAILELLPVGVAVVDARGGVVISNRAVSEIWGDNVPMAQSRADYGAYPAWWASTGEPVAPDEWGLARALTTGEASRLEEIDILAFDGARKTILDSNAPLRDPAGRIIGGMSVIVDITERKQAEERLRHLQEVTEHLVGAQTVAEVRDVVLRDVLTALGASGVGLRRVTPAGLILEDDPMGHGVSADLRRDFARIPFDAEHPAAEAARTGGPIFLRDAREGIERYPGLATAIRENQIQAVAYLPLRHGTDVFGLLSLQFAEPRAWDDGERAFALDLASRAAVALERARLDEAERDARRRLEDADAELRHALQAAAERSDELAATFDAMTEGLVIVNRDGSMRACNRAYRALIGATDDRDLLSQPLNVRMKRMLPRDVTSRPMPEDEWPVQRVLRGESIPASHAIDLALSTLDRREITVGVSGAPMRDADGKVSAAVLVVRDVTERRRFERELEESEEKFRTLADNIPQLAWMAHPNGEIFWYNRRWYEYTGATPESQEGWGWQSVHDPEVLPRVMERWTTSIATGEPFDMTFPLRGADGAFRPFLTRVWPVRDERGRVVRWFGTNTDVAQQRAAEDALRAANRAKDEFLSIASHELRNPAAAIKSVAQLLQRLHARGQLEPARLERYLANLTATSTHLGALVADLLDVSRLETGRIPLRFQPVEVGAFLGEVVDRTEAPASHRIVVAAEPGTYVVEADPDRLRQVLVNLIDNAIKYSPDGGTIVVGLAPDNHGVLLRVRDAGIGLPPGVEERIFQPFGRAANAAERNLPGLGLGLYISRQLIEGQGGRLWAESLGEGQGTTFFLWLPAGSSAPAGDGADA